MDNPEYEYRIVPKAFKNHWVIEYRYYTPPMADIYDRQEGRWSSWREVDGIAFSNPDKAKTYVRDIKEMLKKEIIYFE